MLAVNPLSVCQFEIIKKRKFNIWFYLGFCDLMIRGVRGKRDIYFGQAETDVPFCY